MHSLGFGKVLLGDVLENFSLNAWNKCPIAASTFFNLAIVLTWKAFKFGNFYS